MGSSVTLRASPRLHVIDCAAMGERDVRLCRRFAARPGIDIGDHALWRVTYATDHCFDGKPG